MIDSGRINEIFMDCLFKEDEVVNKGFITLPVYITGITSNVCFHPGRLNEHKEEIKRFINELPECFKEGHSFLNFCKDKEDNLWTGSHRTCEQLLSLGLGIKHFKYCFPKKIWGLLPGSMPYIIIVE